MTSENTQPNKNRCEKCNQKLKLIAIQTGICRCGGLFCPLHIGSKEHNCTYNYLEESKNKIQKNNPIIIPQKV
tara:strand:- start:1113 stop:1331 length:219 start_codon:yes stop_codon:yes gene_type:complete